MPSRSELLFVICVAVALVLYVVASIYAFFHPIFVPLPLLSTLQTPFDMSNVTVAITSPQNDSILQQSAPTVIEWTLADYPMQVIEMHGPEVFHYRVFVNDVQILYEIGLLNHSAPPGGLEDHTTAHSTTPGIQDAVPAPRRATFNTTIRHRVAAAHLSNFGTYNIRVEVQFLIPGSEDGMQTLTQSVTVTKALEVYRTLELLSPSNGSTFAQGESVLLEYKATHVNELEIVIDGSLSALVRNIDDGKFLLRGLGAGTHTIQLRGYDVHDNTIPSSEDVHVMHVQ
uniref:Uncharacterized protein n=1 Tax=Globisporangium ultimum (strain ATCC 200006 / CBS 805.95 / DAOM BR144) TaxID=431595 RepID=K3WD40_GLOUD